jgi:hypothetical protein
MTAAQVFARLEALVCRKNREREVFDWAKGPTIEFAEDPEHIEEAAEEGVSMIVAMRDDLVYRLGEQLPDMASDQVGMPTYRKDMAEARIAIKLAERLQELETAVLDNGETPCKV